MNKSTKPKIVNIVATGKIAKKIDIVKIYQELDVPKKEYEPEVYPGLLIKIEVNGCLRHVTLYKNGKYIITGATSEEDVLETYKILLKKLKSQNFID